MPSLSDVKVTISTDADTKGLKDTEKALGDLDRQGSKTSQSSTGLASTFGNLAKTVAAVGIAFAGYELVKQVESFGMASVASAAELEQTNMSFQNLIGNTKDASKLFGDLTQYANSTPFQVKDVTGSAKQLLAFGETASDTTTLVKQLGDVAAAGGGDLQAMSLVSGQVFAQGKMRAQDMYQVINDGGAGLIHIMAENAGGMQNLTAMFESGGIPAKMYFDAINKATGNGGFAFQGAARQAETFNGRISTLKDSALTFGRELLGVHVSAEKGLEITPGGPFDKMSGAVLEISTKLQNMGPAAATSLTKLQEGFSKAWGVVEKLFGPSLTALFNTIKDKLLPAFERWIPFLEFGAKVLGGELYGALWLVINTLNILANVFGFISQVVTNIGKVFAWEWHTITNLWGGTPNFFTAVGHGIRDAFGAVVSWITSPFRNAYDTVVNLFSLLPGRLASMVTGAMSNIASPIKNALHSLHIPGFATGVHNFGGGLAVVGEQGPELVNLPAGSDVYTNQQSQQMMSGGTNTVNFYGDIKLGDASAVQAFFDQLDQDTLLAGRGLTPNRGMR